MGKFFFSLRHGVHTGSRGHPTSYLKGTRGSFPWYKGARAWSWPLPMNADVKNMWSYTSTSHTSSWRGACVSIGYVFIENKMSLLLNIFIVPLIVMKSDHPLPSHRSYLTSLLILSSYSLLGFPFPSGFPTEILYAFSSLIYTYLQITYRFFLSAIGWVSLRLVSERTNDKILNF
jgi:hypothetical protein